MTDMLNPTEKNILRKIAEMQLISKQELARHLESNGSAGRDIAAVVQNVTKRLMEHRLISTIAPVGSTCYIITQKGAQYLKEQEA